MWAPRRHAAMARRDHSASAIVRSLLRRQFGRSVGTRIRGGDAGTIPRTAFWDALAVCEFEIVDLTGHRYLADAETLAGDRHLTAKAIVRIRSHAGAARIRARRQQPETRRADALPIARRAAIAGDGDQRKRRGGSWCQINDAGAALDMGVGWAHQRRRYRAGLSRGGRWTWHRRCRDRSGRDRGRLGDADAVAELLPGKTSVLGVRILRPARPWPAEAKAKSEAEPEQDCS